MNLILEVRARRLQIANHFNQNICRSRVLVILVITQYGASGLQFQSVVPLWRLLLQVLSKVVGNIDKILEVSNVFRWPHFYPSLLEIILSKVD